MAVVQDTTKRAARKRRRVAVGAAPGTLIADPNARRSELNLTLISPETFEVVDDASTGELARASDDWPITWLDCVGLANIELIEDIGRIFNLHPLALEDVVNTGQRPKAEFFEDHVFVVLSMMDDIATSRYEQIAFFFGEDFVVTFQEREGDPFEPVRRRIEVAQSRLRTKNADYLAYALIDAVVDSYFQPVDLMWDAIDGIEEEMLKAPEQQHVRRLHELRRNVSQLKRALGPLRDAISALIRSDAVCIAPETKIYLNDTLDHILRLNESVESLREMAIGLIEMHLSLSQARINEVINVLTIVSAIFIPLTFLAGIWGMNFDPDTSPWNMPELKAYFGYPSALGFMAFVALSLVAYFRWKKWL
ncbi:magnesium/cobalt transporter CorA [Corticibacterium sp. UT-5YL-CI-8]|nr:magnesium/cobalt transporter CorA [Tianweitania sp. UT-5YL-CI-8]